MGVGGGRRRKQETLRTRETILILCIGMEIVFVSITRVENILS